MRAIVAKSTGSLLAVCLAFSPLSAQAANPTTTTRVELGQSQSSSTEVRWQPTSQVETVTLPWELESTSRQQRRLARPQGGTTVQELENRLYRQVTTRYLMDAKETRTHTTRTRRYALQTSEIQTLQRQQWVTTTREVGAWATRSIETPVTYTEYKVSYKPTLVTVAIPVYRTVTSTASVGGDPVTTNLQGSHTETISSQVTVPVTHTETVAETMLLFNGYGDCHSTGYIGVDEPRANLSGGTSLTLTFSGYPNAPRVLTYTDDSHTVLQYNCPPEQGQPGHLVKLRVDHGATGDTLTFIDNDIALGMYGGFSTIVLPGRVSMDYKTTKDVTTTTYETKTVTSQKVTPVPFSIQLDHLTTKPKDLYGTDATKGVYWKHYHYPGVPCPYESITGSWGMGWGVVAGRYQMMWVPSSPEFGASGKATLLDPAASRIQALGADENKVFTLAYHHTDLLPALEDDRTPITIQTTTQQVLDHTDYREVWENRPVYIPINRPVYHVVAWKNVGMLYRHTHGDPTMRCDNSHNAKHLYTGVIHNATPVFAPLTTTQDVSVWATSSVTALELQTLTSTVSVVIKTVPGEETSDAYTGWSATGETRRSGAGVTAEATRCDQIVLGSWFEGLGTAVPAAARARQASYVSDFGSGSGRQKLSGNQIQAAFQTSGVKASQGVSSPAHDTQTITWPGKLYGRQDAKDAKGFEDTKESKTLSVPPAGKAADPNSSESIGQFWDDEKRKAKRHPDRW